MSKRVWATHTLSVLSAGKHSNSGCGRMGVFHVIAVPLAEGRSDGKMGWERIQWYPNKQPGVNDNIKKPRIGNSYNLRSLG